jgi:prepilin-type N-terminal cleavage/methylation domain-containing protein
MKSQRGFTLVEVLLTVAILGIVGSVAGISLVQIVDMTDYGNRSLTADNDLQKAAYWFNLDTQAAVSASAGSVLTLTLPDSSTISYTLSATDLQRTTITGTRTLARNVSALAFSTSGHTVSMDITTSLAGRTPVVSQQVYQASMRPQVYVPPPSTEYRMKLTFANGTSTENLPNFPVLVRLTSAQSDFWTRVNSGITTTDTKDVHFRDSDGATELYFQAEFIDYASKVAYFWVRVPQIDAASNTDYAYIYYGKAGATQSSYNSPNNVWDSNYRLVLHLSENTATVGGLKDSTSYANNGTSYNNNNPAAYGWATAQVDGGQVLTGNKDNIRVPNSASLTFTGPITFETLIQITNQNDGQVIQKGYNPGNGIFESKNAGWTAFVRVNGANKTAPWGGNQPALNTWYHVAMTWDSSNLRIYVNGTLRNTVAAAGTRSNIAEPVYLGSDVGQSRDITGYMDESRISSVARSASWLYATYQCEFYTYITFGTPEAI